MRNKFSFPIVSFPF